MRNATLFFVALASLALAACGPGAEEGDDIQLEPDADPNEMPDADTTAAKSLGSACTPDQANPMGPGDCGAGFVCLALADGNGAWCSKTCTGPSDASCDTGFTGAGIGYCYLQVDFDGNMTPDGNFCGIICQDTTGTCTDCNNTCPAPLMCTAELQSGQPPMVVAHGCE